MFVFTLWMVSMSLILCAVMAIVFGAIYEAFASLLD
jgi:hypothetical protein